MNLPTLYKKTSVGADQVWDIWTEDNVIVTRWGQLNGAIQETRDEVKKGKNVGRSNETTPTQQAESEAKSRWEKKLKKGYVKSLDDARAGRVDGIITGGIFPMLAQKFSEHGHKLVYPCWLQPKLDGHRCIAVLQDGECTLWTRSRKPITSMNHICAAIEALGLPDCMLDGELYNHDLRDEFDELSSYIRDTEAKPGSEKVQYHVYDLAEEGLFSERTELLQGIGRHFPKGGPLVLVETLPADDEDELMLRFEHYLSIGYEGAIARNSDGPYVNKRSYDLLKIKEFDDGEFTVVGVKEGRGKMAGHAVFICHADNGEEFEAKMKGKLSDLRQYWEDPSLAVGRSLTVQYQGLTQKKVVPRFPVALRFREDV